MIRKTKSNKKYKNLREEKKYLEEQKRYQFPSGRKYKLDGHVHTNECGHAYSTLQDLVRCAKKAGLDMFCWTEHSTAMPGSVSELWFSNLKAVPPSIDGVRILKGMEADILNEEGDIACSEDLKSKLEILSASLHSVCIQPKDKETNTRTVINTMKKNPEIDFFCHLGNPQYPIDFRKVVEAAKKYNKMIEINNGSFYIRKGSKENCTELARLCKEYEVPVIVGTDTHYCEDIGDFQMADRCLIAADFPDELIMNLNPGKLIDYLESKGKKLGTYTRDPKNAVFK